MSTRDIIGQQARPKGAATALRVGGSAVGFAGYLLGICSLPLVVKWRLGGTVTDALALYYSAGFLLGNLGRRMDLRGRRIASPVMGPEWMPREDSFVLYLRSFSDDDAFRSMDMQFHSGNQISGWGAGDSVIQSGFTREEQMVAALRMIGPVAAVGKPGERIPEAGALRTYRPDGEWQDAVVAFMHRARFVFIVIGSAGEGLTWELAQALQRVPPDRLALVVFNEFISRERYMLLQQRLAGQSEADGGYRLTLPDYPALSFPVASWIITFGGDGRSRIAMLALKNGSLLSSTDKIVYRSFRKLLRPIADRLAQADGARPRRRQSERASDALAAAGRFLRLAALPALIFQFSRSAGLQIVAVAFVAVVLRALFLSLWRPSG